jgi:D-methionine transport system substrate-binding protein
VVPNAALESGELQAYSFQHKPYLDNQKADRGYKIEPVGYTVNFPIGIYSKKHKSWDAIPQGGTLSIPNDPTNGGRVLLLLRDKGWCWLQADHRRHCLEPQEAEDRRTRCRADTAHAG